MASNVGARQGTAVLSRSMYLHRLRRAFLLRVHPDRFRNRGSGIGLNQATLVKALSERMGRPDFAAWQQRQRHRQPRSLECLSHFPEGVVPGFENRPYPYLLERRDGSLVKAEIRLDGSVDEILESMAKALADSGAAASLPEPPPSSSGVDVAETGSLETIDGWEWFAPPDGGAENVAPGTVNRQFDFHSNLGRNLWCFLERLDGTEVERRMASRMDAQAAALQVRRLYRFQAVDAVQLGWSSSSVAVLLRQLLALHEEHANKFRTDQHGFYPLRLVFTSGDYHGTIDVFGGVLRLNPGLTPIQWLDSLRLVTPELLQTIRSNRSTVSEKTATAQALLGVQLKKGHSCSSREYLAFLERLCRGKLPSIRTKEMVNPEGTGSSLALEPVVATVESSQASRRARVAGDGTIRLGADMAAADAASACRRLSDRARDRAAQERRELERCREAVLRLQWGIGLQRVHRAPGSGGLVSHAQFLDCLARILQEARQEQKLETLKNGLAGRSLGIGGTGQFCHLADDGSIVIPHDWS